MTKEELRAAMKAKMKELSAAGYKIRNAARRKARRKKSGGTVRLDRAAQTPIFLDQEAQTKTMSIKRYRPRNTTVNKWGQITTTPAEAKAMIQAFEKSKMAELKAAGFRLPKRGKSSKPGKSAWNRH